MAAVVASKVRKQRAKDLNRKDNKEEYEEVKKRQIKVCGKVLSVMYHFLLPRFMAVLAFVTLFTFINPVINQCMLQLLHIQTYSYRVYN